MFTLDLARAHIRELTRAADKSRRAGPPRGPQGPSRRPRQLTAPPPHRRRPLHGPRRRRLTGGGVATPMLKSPDLRPADHPGGLRTGRPRADPGRGRAGPAQARLGRAHRARSGSSDRSPGCSPAARAGGSPGSRRGLPARPAARPGRWRRTTTPTSCAASTGRSARPRTTSPRRSADAQPTPA